MTPASKDFITPLTLSTLSKNKVLSSFFGSEDKTWNNHVDLGLWADIMLIAPATANTISKMANGGCDNLLLATYLSAKCPVFVAPAMDLDMYIHPSVVKNTQTLSGFGNTIIPAESGELASGLVGEGRMAEPENIVCFLEESLKNKQILNGKKVLITAGPTHEKIDPVRFIGNHSTGKMGFALAEQASLMGAEVTLISGPSSLKLKDSSIKRIDIESADEMFLHTEKHFKDTDIAIFSAAVADYKPKHVFDKKIKKENTEIDFNNIELVKNIDILSTLSNNKDQQIVVGFALETDNEIENAISKIERKNLDFIVLNSLRDKGSGFGTDTNKVSLIDKNKQVKSLPLLSKKDVAIEIYKYIIKKNKI